MPDNSESVVRQPRTCCLGLPIPFASWPFRSATRADRLQLAVHEDRCRRFCTIVGHPLGIVDLYTCTHGCLLNNYRWASSFCPQQFVLHRFRLISSHLSQGAHHGAHQGARRVPRSEVMLGFPGCGTTSASKVLASHPNLSMVSRDPKGHSHLAWAGAGCRWPRKLC